MNDELLDRLWEVFCNCRGNNLTCTYISFKNIYDKELNWLIYTVSKSYLAGVIGIKNNLLLVQLINSDDISNHIIAFEMIYKHYLDNNKK